MRKLVLLFIILCLLLSGCANTENDNDNSSVVLATSHIKQYIAYQRWWKPHSSMKEMIIDDVDFYNVSIYKASKENDVFGFRFLDYGNFLIVDLKSEEVVQISNFVESDFEHHSDDTIIDIPSKPVYSYTDDEKRMYESVINALYIDLEEVSKYDYNWSNATIYVMHFELYESLIMIFLCLNDGEVLSTSYFYENKDGEILIDSLNGYDSFSELSLSEDELQFLDRVKSDALSVIEYNTGQTFKVIKSRIDE